MNDKIVYWNKEVASILQIGDSTLRKWCILFEEHGYTFLKDENGKRGFRDKDVIVLRRLKNLNKADGMTLENAVNAVLSMVNEEQGTNIVQSEIGVNEGTSIVLHSTDIQEIKDHMSKQEQFNKALLERMDEQKKYYESLIQQQQQHIENSIKTRDEQLMSAIREVTEVRRLQAAVEEQEKSKKKWFKWWGK